MARKPECIALNEQQHETLSMWSTSGKTEQRIAKRAQVILLSSTGKSFKEIASETHLIPMCNLN